MKNCLNCLLVYFSIFIFLSCGDSTGSSKDPDGENASCDYDRPTDSQEETTDFDEPTSSQEEIPYLEIRKGVYKIRGNDPDLKTDDLQTLKKLIGDAEVVALGESVHTSGGYYRMKHRIFKFLVEKMNFRAFAFESPWIPADYVRDYVASGERDAETVVGRALFGVWASREVVELVEYMRKWNEENPDDPVHFFGFDLQQPGDDSQKLFDYLSSLDMPDSADFIERIKQCDGVDGESEREKGIPDEKFNGCMKALNDLEEWCDSNRPEIAKSIGEESFEWLKLHIMGLVSWEEEAYYFSSDPARSYDARDSKMAVMFEKMRELRYPGIKCAIWAHNWHIAKRTDVLYDQAVSNVKSMGTHLYEKLGETYVSIGLLGYEVGINWPGYKQGTLPLPSPGDIESQLHELGEEYLFVDLGSPSQDAFIVQDEFSVFNKNIGDIYSQFDGVLFLDKTEGMDSLY